MKALDDRLSELPDSLILEILSLLTTRDAVRTTTLSKRWMDLWTSIPCLNFKQKKMMKMMKNIDQAEFISQVQKHWKGSSIRKFEISFIDDHPLSGEIIDSWLRFATENKVQDLLLNLPFQWRKPLTKSPELYWLPQCIYSCSSITNLRINGCHLGIQENVHVQWDNLKTLYLQGSCFSEDVINQVVSSAPRLETLELRLRRSRDNLNIESNSLKTLTVAKYNEYTREYDPSRYTVLTICAPKLESLHLSGNAYSDCNLLMDGLSLTHATLCFYDKWCAVLEKTLNQLLPAIKHVEALTLSPCAFKMLGVMQVNKSISPFWTVKTLKVFGGPVKAKEIVGLAKIFLQVDKLVIDWKVDDWYPSFLENLAKNNSRYIEIEAEAWRARYLLMQLRKVEITGCVLPAVLPLIVFLRQHETMLQEIVLNGVDLGAFEGKVNKLQAKLKHCFKWGILPIGFGIAVTALTFIKIRRPS